MIFNSVLRECRGVGCRKERQGGGNCSNLVKLDGSLDESHPVEMKEGSRCKIYLRGCVDRTY